MAENKKSFVAYVDWNTTFEKLSDEEAGKLAKMMFSYVNDENPNAPDRITELLFEPIKNQLKRDLKAYQKTLEKQSEKGRLGNLKRWNSDLYKLVINESITLENAELIAKNRHSDKNIATAIKTSPNIADIDVDNDIEDDIDILLEKETKNAGEEISNFDFSESVKNPEEEKKEKSCAKKEKDLEDLKESEFFKKVCDYFSQTTDRQRMNVFGEMVRIYDQNEIEEFQKQTNAYMEYKPLADEKPHSWMNYPSQWKNQNWIDKLQKLKSKNGKSNNQAGRSGAGNISGRAKVIASGNITEFT